jgi:putative Mn2+ efflux pump MntP
MDQIITYLNKSAITLNENKYFIGFTMILLNIGARFIIDELDDDLRKMVSDKYVRRFFIFCSFFMATKDVFTSVILTIVFVIIINEFLGSDEGKKKEVKGGATFNKQELSKTIQQLQTIQTTM